MLRYGQQMIKKRYKAIRLLVKSLFTIYLSSDDGQCLLDTGEVEKAIQYSKYW